MATIFNFLQTTKKFLEVDARLAALEAKQIKKPEFKPEPKPKKKAADRTLLDLDKNDAAINSVKTKFG